MAVHVSRGDAARGRGPDHDVRCAKVQWQLGHKTLVPKEGDLVQCLPTAPSQVAGQWRRYKHGNGRMSAKRSRNKELNLVWSDFFVMTLPAAPLPRPQIMAAFQASSSSSSKCKPKRQKTVQLVDPEKKKARRSCLV